VVSGASMRPTSHSRLGTFPLRSESGPCFDNGMRKPALQSLSKRWSLV